MHILIISQRSYLTGSIRSYLEQAGIEVSVADNDPQMIESDLDQNPDLVLLQLVQSNSDVTSMCQYVRSQSNVPLVVVGPHHVADTVAALRQGADGYVPRPVDNRELLARMRAVTRRARWCADSAV